MNTEQRVNLMRERLQQNLMPSHLEIIDESNFHVGHAGAEGGAGHYSVCITSDHFKGKSPIACHRLVYGALGDLMDHEIHALRIQVAS